MKLMKVLNGEAVSPPPVWLMRQAGRYLPEYRQVRAKAGSFLNLCYSPEMASEVTLQPIRRFGFDAAILFSDILVIPDALGQKVDFVEGHGPVLEKMDLKQLIDLKPDRALEHLAPVFETVHLVRQALDPGTALIGFCGAPWTVATYMIASHGTVDQGPARRASYEMEEEFSDLIDLIVDVSSFYLIEQIKCGADTVQIFDSWAGILDDYGFERWSIDPARRIIERVRSVYPGTPIILFAKGAGSRIGRYAKETGASAVGLDWSMPIADASRSIPDGIALQGNLDPMRLIVGGEALTSGVDAILTSTDGRPHIFNLGHGITPETPIDHVTHLVRQIRGSIKCSG